MNNKLIGRILATEKSPTTIDNFIFWTQQDFVLNPFDIIKVEHVQGSFTYGIIQDISHITDAASFLANYISSDFGNVDVNENTIRVGMNYIEAKMLMNTKNIYIPVQNNAKVYLATKEEITLALGLDNIKNPFTCGYLEMYKGLENEVTLPIQLNRKFVVGPEGAHLNISGISGLAAKTSYAMFLMKAIQESYEKSNEDGESVAFVIFNVKGKDLLSIDQKNDFADESNPSKAKVETYALYEMLKLTTEPFKNVKYYFPKSDANGGHWNTYLTPEEVSDMVKTQKGVKYSFTYEDDKDDLDLLFANIDDTTQTMDAIINYIMANQGNFNGVNTWKRFLEVIGEKCQGGSDKSDKEIPVASWRKFNRIVKKAIYGNKIFSNDIVPSQGEARIRESLKYIKENEVHVIDIAKLPEDMQAFVFGDSVRTICDLQLGEYSGDENVSPPKRIVIFIDELNKYASKEIPKNSPILRQILDVAERGRSLGIVLFAAEQFRSAIHDRVTGNCSTHAYGRTNSIETSSRDYSHIPSVYKNIMTRLKQGEYIIQNPIFTSPLNIKFPKPIYKQDK